MIEKKINIHPKVQAIVFGKNDVNYNAIKAFFPKMKFVLRGDMLKYMGDEKSIHHFDKIWNRVMDYYENFNRLPLSTLKDLLSDNYKLDNSKLSGKEVLVYGNKGRVIKARTKNQLKMVSSIQKNDLLFAVGPAGSGKTYTAVALAVKALKERVVKKIILTRPAVEAGENLESGVIQIAPLGFMRGRTLDQAFVILDEGQNTTQSQIKMFLTRMGRSAKFIVTGDVTQVDLPKNQVSGLKIALELFKDHSEISIVNLDEHDVIRHQLVKTIINAFNKK